jgi:hypothetical protein
MQNLLGIETKNELPYVRPTRPLDLVVNRSRPNDPQYSRLIVSTTWLIRYDLATLDASDRGITFLAAD